MKLEKYTENELARLNLYKILYVDDPEHSKIYKNEYALGFSVMDAFLNIKNMYNREHLNLTIVSVEELNFPRGLERIV